MFVPSYSGNRMVMLKINDMNDFESLPMTKWNIRQPNDDGSREDATETGEFTCMHAWVYVCVIQHPIL